MAGLHDPIEGKSAWVGAELSRDDYRVPLTLVCREEILRLAEELCAFPLPTIVLDPREFELPACRAMMREVRWILDAGVRFAVAGPLPLGEVGVEAATQIYWLLAGMLARPVAQKLDGTLLYDVEDTGQEALPGSGVRPDKTNIEIRFHNDNAYNLTPPDYVGLLSIRAAAEGGRSRVASFHTAHNRFAARHPELLPRFYEPFWFDRQREFLPGESPIFAAPVFERAGEVKARFSAHQIRGGYALKGEPIDNRGAAAVEALLRIFEEKDLAVDFDLEPGEMQFVDNRAVGHSRTAFLDDPDPMRRRRLVRLWLRDHGRRAYPG
ncbi:MAG TPA: TauD/TfdA family dioxygenase [Stellaceae bacterium]|nr:TauD/TfdA family dioxygenase [Stellaceae bacterium]